MVEGLWAHSHTWPDVSGDAPLHLFGGLTLPSLLLFVASGPASLPRCGRLHVREVRHEPLQFFVRFELVHDPDVRQEARQVCFPNRVPCVLPVFQELLYGDLVQALGAIWSSL
jgi:hypothetical protein